MIQGNLLISLREIFLGHSFSRQETEGWRPGSWAGSLGTPKRAASERRPLRPSGPGNSEEAQPRRGRGGRQGLSARMQRRAFWALSGHSAHPAPHPGGGGARCRDPRPPHTRAGPTPGTSPAQDAKPRALTRGGAQCPRLCLGLRGAEQGGCMHPTSSGVNRPRSLVSLGACPAGTTHPGQVRGQPGLHHDCTLT